MPGHSAREVSEEERSTYCTVLYCTVVRILYGILLYCSALYCAVCIVLSFVARYGVKRDGAICNGDM